MVKFKTRNYKKSRKYKTRNYKKSRKLKGGTQSYVAPVANYIPPPPLTGIKTTQFNDPPPPAPSPLYESYPMPSWYTSNPKTDLLKKYDIFLPKKYIKKNDPDWTIHPSFKNELSMRLGASRNVLTGSWWKNPPDRHENIRRKFKSETELISSKFEDTRSIAITLDINGKLANKNNKGPLSKWQAPPAARMNFFGEWVPREREIEPVNDISIIYKKIENKVKKQMYSELAHYYWRPPENGVNKIIWDKIAAKLFPDNNKDSKKYTQKFISNVWEISIDIMKEAHKEGNWDDRRFVPNAVIIDILQLLQLPNKIFECIDNKNLCSERDNDKYNNFVKAKINEWPISIAFNKILNTRIYGKLNDGTSFNQYNRVLDVSSDKKFDIMKWVDNNFAIPSEDKSVTSTQPSITTVGPLERPEDIPQGWESAAATHGLGWFTREGKGGKYYRNDELKSMYLVTDGGDRIIIKNRGVDKDWRAQLRDVGLLKVA